MAEITLLDGSIGQELVKRSGDKPTGLWSTQVMIDHPGLVRDVHASYFETGATVATANTYAVLRDRLRRVGIEEHFETLLSTAMTTAKEARDAAGGGRVAVSLGPLNASYRPDIFPPAEEAAEVYSEIVAHVKETADLFLIETVTSLEHAEGALRATGGHGKPVWLAMSTDDFDGSVFRSGEPLIDAAPIVASHQVDAVLLNCSRPEVVADGLEIIKSFDKPFGAYANGFTKISDGFKKEFPTVDALTQRTDLGPEPYAAFAMGWVDQGASIVGGCCEVGPDHIAELARQLRDAGHILV
ncbi:MAG: homocysteine S-methyltransferase family protein [Pseudomonadota bacterium]